MNSKKVYESSNTNTNLISKGFKDNGLNVTDYTYDENGNVTFDANKDVTITYNHLNLPTQFYWSTNQYINITYDAAGVKLTKTKYLSGTTTTKHYVGGIEYDGNDLEAVYHAEGRAVYNKFAENAINNFVFEYSIKDHLGNSRVMFSDLNGNGQVTEAEIIQVEHYYPFGMKQEGHGNAIISETNYTYNGKELNSDFGLDLHDYGARWYDASIGRWHGVDPLAEAFIVHSPYNYGVNNPIMMIDPDGRASQCAMCGGNVSGYRTGAEQSVKNDKRHAQWLKHKNGEVSGSDIAASSTLEPYGYRVEDKNGNILKNVVEGYNVINVTTKYAQEIIKIEVFQITSGGTEKSIGYGYYFQNWELIDNKYHPQSFLYPDNDFHIIQDDPYFNSNPFNINITIGNLSPDHSLKNDYLKRLITVAAGGGVYAEAISISGVIFGYEGTTEYSGGERKHRTGLGYSQGLQYTPDSNNPSNIFEQLVLTGTVGSSTKILPLIDSGAADYNVKVAISSYIKYSNHDPDINRLE